MVVVSATALAAVEATELSTASSKPSNNRA
jgi:hypothetical protein